MVVASPIVFVALALAMAALLARATCADVAGVQDDILLYKSSARKGVKSATMRQLAPSYIPDQQCSGLIQQVSCPPQVTNALEVVVLDGSQYAEVRIHDSLALAEVFRRPNAASGRCEGDAQVRVSLSCGGYRRILGGQPAQPRPSRRRRRRAPRTPRAPRPMPLPPARDVM